MSTTTLPEDFHFTQSEDLSEYSLWAEAVGQDRDLLECALCGQDWAEAATGVCADCHRELVGSTLGPAKYFATFDQLLADCEVTHVSC